MPVHDAILAVDDDAAILNLFRLAFLDAGYEDFIPCQDCRDVMGILARQSVGIMILDLRMPGVSGEDILPDALSEYPQIPIIVVSGTKDVSAAVSCVKQGAFDYFEKPVDLNRLLLGVKRAFDFTELRRQQDSFRRRLYSQDLSNPAAFSGIVTSSPSMTSLFHYIEVIAPTSQPVLITGETGVGKELVAKVIHDLSDTEGPFVPINVSGIDDTLFSDTMFGHERGAFSGAETDYTGIVEEAARGSLFLDEIGDLSPSSQVKLLRLIQENEYSRLGATARRTSSARIIVATNKDLRQSIEQNTFRKDLFYRLNTHRVHVPPLRERPDDIPPLLEYYVKEVAQSLGRPVPALDHQVSEAFRHYPFPGNVRELKSLVYDALAKHSVDRFTLSLLGPEFQPPHESPNGPLTGGAGGLFASCDTLPSIPDVTRALIDEALERSGGNQTAAAKLLNISRAALNKRLLRSRR